jgi:diguanylate cyclase (GGDEF)-like protein
MSVAEQQEQAPLRLSEGTVLAIKQVVRDEPWAINFPDELLPAYGLRRQHEFRRLVGPGTPLLLLLQFLLVGYALLMYFPAVTGPDRRLWWSAEAGVSLLVVIGLGLARVPAMLARYELWVGVAATGILALRVGQTFAFGDAALLQHQSYVCMLVIMVIVLALRLRIAASVAVCSVSLLLALSAAWFAHWPVDFRRLLVYHGQAVMVALFVAFLLERQQRLAFLQSVLLARESEEKQQLNDRLERLAREDGLTGLANRRHFDQALAVEWERASRERQPLALLMVDVDHFKAFNDLYGHPSGDACLSRIGSVLSAVARRPGDMAARYGGEEFVVLLPGTDAAGAVDVAERILAGMLDLGIPHEASSASDRVTVSIGLMAQVPSPGSPARTLVDDADAALYAAKHSGRNRVVRAATSR